MIPIIQINVIALVVLLVQVKISAVTQNIATRGSGKYFRKSVNCGPGAMTAVALVKPVPLKSILLCTEACMDEKSLRVTRPESALKVN